MRNLLLALALLSIAGAQTVPENLRPSRSGRAVWIASIAALTAANIADAHTSWNKTEANRLLAGKDGNFGTRGAAMVAGANAIKIHGDYVPVRAEVIQIENLSAHADANEILGWLSNFQAPPKKIFITHGEADAADALRVRIEERLKWTCCVPEYLQEETLE